MKSKKREESGSSTESSVLEKEVEALEQAESAKMAANPVSSEGLKDFELHAKIEEVEAFVKGEKPRLALDESVLRLDKEEEERWRDPTCHRRILDVVDLLAQFPRRPAFSGETSAAQRAMLAHLAPLQEEGLSLKLRALASARPVPNVIFCYGLLGFLSIFVSFFAPFLGSLLAWLVVGASLGEMFFGVRFLRYFFPSQSTHNVCLEEDGAQEEASLILCASVDTPTYDLFMRPDPQGPELYGGKITFMMLFQGVLLLNPLVLVGVPSGGWRWFFVSLLVLLLGTGMFSSLWFRREQEGTLAQGAAVGVALEAFRRLRGARLPFRLKLLLVGASEGGAGLDCYGWPHRPPAEGSLFVYIEPLGTEGSGLHYVKAEGILLPRAFDRGLIRSVDWASARVAHPRPLSKVGDGLAWRASLRGMASLGIGSSSSEPLAKTLDLELLDQAAGFIASFVENVAFERSDENERSPFV